MSKFKSNFKQSIQSNIKRQESAASNYGYLKIPRGIDVLSLEPDCRMKLDFIPYLVTDKKHPDRDPDNNAAMQGDLWYRRPFYIHRNVGVQKDIVVCLTSFGEHCPICEYRTLRRKEGADKEELDGLRASLRNLYVVIPIDHSKLDEKLHVLDISDYNFELLLRQELKDKPEYSGFPDLEAGYTLDVRFVAKTIGSNSPFPTASRIDFLPRKHQYDDSILEKVPNLDVMLVKMTYKELENLFHEYPEVDVEESETGGAPIEPEKIVYSEVAERKPKNLAPEKELISEQPKQDSVPEQAPIRRKAPVESSSEGEEKCPYGHKYGIDAEEYTDCDDCTLWDPCMEEKEKRKRRG